VAKPTTTKLPTADVVPLFGFRPQIEDEPEFRTRAAPISNRRTDEGAGADAMDLTDKAKLWLMIGRGGLGKSWLARWLSWRMAEAGRSAVIAALDPGNRSLATWFSDVQQPETSDPTTTLRFLTAGIDHLARERRSAIFDFGGGDLSLRSLVDLAPDFTAPLIAAGVEPIACYCLGPDPETLVSLGSLEDAGFAPRSTLLVLNEGAVDSAQSREEAFARVSRHSDFRAAIARGAVMVWMPRLEKYVADEINGKHLTFGQARDGLVPEGARFSPIGGIDRSMVGRWLERMEIEFRSVASWLP
jgi:hypothetical protein